MRGGLRIKEGEGRERGAEAREILNGSIVFSTNCWGYYSKERGCLKLERTEMREFLF